MTTTLDRLKAAGTHASALSNRNRTVRVITDKTGILIMATQHHNGQILRQETTYRLHSDLDKPGQTGRGEIIDAIDRTVTALNYATTAELVAHLSGRPPLNVNMAKVA